MERVIKRSDYDSDNVNNDIALLRLDRDVEWSENAQPVCLPGRGLTSYNSYYWNKSTFS